MGIKRPAMLHAGCGKGRRPTTKLAIAGAIAAAQAVPGARLTHAPCSRTRMYAHAHARTHTLQAVIDWKWTQYCHKALLLELSFYMLWLLSFAVFTILFQVGRPS